MEMPAASAPFSEKLAYYRTQHSSDGVRATHMIGLPVIVFAMPLVLARPRLGLPLFAAGWGLNIAGHRAFEHNNPSLKHGPVTYQLAGLAHWAEEVGDALARRSGRKEQRRGTPSAPVRETVRSQDREPGAIG